MDQIPNRFISQGRGVQVQFTQNKKFGSLLSTCKKSAFIKIFEQKNLLLLAGQTLELSLS